MSSRCSSCLQLFHSPAEWWSCLGRRTMTGILWCQEDFTASCLLLKDFNCRLSRFIWIKCLAFKANCSCSLISSSNSNVGIRELPTELGQLSNLWQLDIEDLNITNVPQEVRKEGTVLNTSSLFFQYVFALKTILNHSLWIVKYGWKMKNTVYLLLHW